VLGFFLCTLGLLGVLKVCFAYLDKKTRTMKANISKATTNKSVRRLGLFVESGSSLVVGSGVAMVTSPGEL
jgi:hypothetical protein